MQTDAIFWLAVLIIMLVIEIVTLGLATIWFAGGALAAFAASFFGAPMWLEIILFLAVSIALLLLTRPMAVKYLNQSRVKTNVESLIGCDAVVISEINNLAGVGLITVAGQEWSAKTEDNDNIIPVGSVVTIKEIKGVRAVVRLKEGI